MMGVLNTTDRGDSNEQLSVLYRSIYWNIDLKCSVDDGQQLGYTEFHALEETNTRTCPTVTASAGGMLINDHYECLCEDNFETCHKQGGIQSKQGAIVRIRMPCQAVTAVMSTLNPSQPTHA